MRVDWETPVWVIGKHKKDSAAHTVVERGGEKEKESACVVSIT